MCTEAINPGKRFIRFYSTQCYCTSTGVLASHRYSASSPCSSVTLGEKPRSARALRRVGERVAHVALLHGLPPDVERLAVNAGNDLEERG